MAGRGPAPGANPRRKPADQRRRRNKEPQFEQLAPDIEAAPKLPKTYRAKVMTEDGPAIKQVPFLKETRDWYDDWARSAMARAGKLSRVHWRRLQMLAKTVDRYHRDPGNVNALKEIRLNEAGFGGTPMDARRLGFEIGEPEAEKPEAAPLAPVRRLRAVDAS